MADTTAVKELFSVDNDTRMPDTVNLLANELLRHSFGHPLGQVVNVKFYWVHFFINS